MNSIQYSGLSAFVQANKGILSFAAILVALYGVKTFSRNAAWANNITLAATT